MSALLQLHHHSRLNIFKGFGKDSRNTVRESFKCWDLLRLILDTWRYVAYLDTNEPHNSTATMPVFGMSGTVLHVCPRYTHD